MEKLALTRDTDRPTNYNKGQYAERHLANNITGEVRKADNKPHTECGDVLDIQVKSARATVCKGTDIDTYLAIDASNRYAYVTADFKTAYIMTKAEYTAFVKKFAKVTYESKKNGGGEKMRLPHETKALIAYLESL